MMPVLCVEGLGPLVNLARALGIMSGTQVREAWFSNPSQYLGRILRNSEQREALLDALDELATEGDELPADERGRRWVRVTDHDSINIAVVLHEIDGAVELGVGARVQANAPNAEVETYIPLIRVPHANTDDAFLVLGDARGRIDIGAFVDFDTPQPDALLHGIGIRADVPSGAGGDPPILAVTLRGLRFEGDDERRNISLGEGGVEALPNEAIRLAGALLRSASRQAAGHARELLELLGLGTNAAIPRLPIAELLSEGITALHRWLDDLVRNSMSFQAWIERFASFIALSLPPARAPIVSSDQVTWTLESGTQAGLTFSARPGPGGESIMELGGFAQLSGGGPPPGTARFEATVIRATIGGANPTAMGLPSLSLSGRFGPAPNIAGADLVPQADLGDFAVSVRALRIGLELVEDRRARFVLAAESVRITVGGNTTTYTVLDLTNADALVVVAGAAAGDVLDNLMDQLGPAAVQARIVFGLDEAENGWPVELVSIFDLMTQPVESVLAYHQRVITDHAAGYPRLVEAMAALLNLGALSAVAGTGTDEDPWIVEFADGIGIAAWRTGAGPGELHLGLFVSRQAADLGGSCPRVSFGVRVELSRIDLGTRHARALAAIDGTLTFGARGGVPLRIGNESGALIADELGLRLRFADGELTPNLVAPGLAAEMDGEAIPFALPSVDAGGAFVGDVPWHALERLGGVLLENAGPVWARELGRLFGWLGGQTPRLSIENLLADPLPELQSLLGRAPLDEVIGFLSLLVNGPATGSLPRGVTLGVGGASAPLTIPLQLGDQTSPGLFFAASGMERSLGLDVFRPDELVALITGATPTLATSTLGARLTSILAAAGELELSLHDALCGRPDLATGLSALTERFAASDGIVRAEHAAFAGAVSHMVKAGHGALDSLDLEAITGQAVDEQTLLVTLGSGWSGINSGTIVDLSTPGLPAAAFDVSNLETIPGPWVVRLPSRRDATTTAGEDPTSAQAERLNRAIAALETRMQGAAAVKIVALGGAGHAARIAAATAPGVTHLVTLGTAHGALNLDILDDGPAAQSLQFFGALLPPRSDRTELPAASLGRDLIGPLLDAYHGGDRALEDLAPPSTAPPALPAGVTAHAIAGRVGADGAQAAVSALIARILQSVYENQEIARALSPAAGSPVFGLGTRLAGGDDVVVGVDARLDLWQPGAAQLGPVIAVRVDVSRPGGFLAGGPDPTRSAGTQRNPSVRRCEIEITVPLLHPDDADTRLVLHEAEALGVRRLRWEVSSTSLASTPLDEASRLLVGRAFGALGPLPATGRIRELVDALDALDLLEAPPVDGGDVGLAVAAFEQLVADPVAFMQQVRTRHGHEALSTALSRLLGAPVPDPSTPTRVDFTASGLQCGFDFDAGSLHLDATDLALNSGLSLAGSVVVDGAGVRGNASLSVSDSGMRLEFSSNPNTIMLRSGAAGSISEPIRIYPAFDGPGLAHLLTQAVPAAVLSAGMTFVRTIDTRVNALLDPVLEVLGLLVHAPQGNRVRVPLALLGNPRAWMEDARVLGGASGSVDPDRLIILFDALGDLLGIRGPNPGTLSLPAGITIAADRSTAGVAQLVLSAAGIQGGRLRMSGAVELQLPVLSVPPQLVLSAAVALDGNTPIEASSRLVAEIGAGGTELRLAFASGSEITLLPPGPGLGAAAATAAAQYALPLALDAVVSIGDTIGNGIRDLGDALNLRIGGNFDGDELLALAEDPVAQLASRLRSGGDPAFVALADLISEILPAGWNVNGANSTFELSKAGVLSLTASSPAPSQVALALAVEPIVIFPDAMIDGEVQITSAGLVRLRARFQVDPVAPLDARPIRFAPGVEVDVGPDAVAGDHLAVWLAAAGGARLEGHVAFGTPWSFQLSAPGASSLAVGAVQVLLPIAMDTALFTAELQTMLDQSLLESGGVPATNLRELLEGVLLQTAAGVSSLDAGVLNPDDVFRRTLILARNLARQVPVLDLDPLSIRVGAAVGDPELFGITLSIVDGQRVTLVDGDVQLALEVDSTWIRPPGDGGLRVDLLRVPAGEPTLEPGISIRGLGLRVQRSNAPLLDALLKIGSLALHGYIEFSDSGVGAGGGQLEIGGLAIPLGGGDGGDAVASGILTDAASGKEQPDAQFSPAIAVQVGPPPSGTRIGFRAGPGEGPWWIGIRRSFGPVYLEQIGLGIEQGEDQPESISVLVDGKVSMLGLTVSVDDLALTADYGTPLYLPSAWSVSLAGLAVDADMGGVKIAGGLRRGSGAPDYLGMLSVRWAVYGITAFGGYAVLKDGEDEYTAFFLFGALNAPLGGVPQFFVTGIGAGVGINRLLVLPTDLSKFATFPLIAALDANGPAADPDDAMNQMKAAFPPGRGCFWLAAGISFTSFALVEGIVVVGIEVGDGLQIAILGLARVALPRPQLKLAQIELGLIARFSTRDGVLWVQAQLTDESWFLTKDCRLTGGFAYVMWFTGERAGEFVLTLGGYHPSFRREGYPVVPRLGFVWNISSILVIKGESYFALTSEAIMAGVRFEARLDAGPLWAYVRFGADGIVYFDPFWFQVSAYAAMGAGITIKIDLGWFGTIRITISINLHGDVVVEGPEIRGRATIDLDVATATISFGNWNGSKPPDLIWPDFRRKFLEQSDEPDAAARILSVTPGIGLQPGSPGDNRATPTGGSDDPFRLVPEFALEVRSRGAASDLVAGARVAPSIVNLAIAPMGRPAITSRIKASIQSTDGVDWTNTVEFRYVKDLFPKGIWAARPDPKTVPKGDLLEAYSGWTILASAEIRGGTPEIDYYQVETDERLPLPFEVESSVRGAWTESVGVAAKGRIFGIDSHEHYSIAATWKEEGELGTVDRLAEARRRPARRSPPQLIMLAAGSTEAPLAFHFPEKPAPARPAEAVPSPRPRLEAKLSLPANVIEEARVRTTVDFERRRGLVALAPPSAEALLAQAAHESGARLIVRTPGAKTLGETVVAAHVPRTTAAGSGIELRRTHSRGTLDETCCSFELGEGVIVHGGDILVFRLPGADEPRTLDPDVAEPDPDRVALDGPARVVFLAPMGRLLNSTYIDNDVVAVPRGTERFVLVPGARTGMGSVGWHTDTMLAQVGETTFIGPGCALRVSSATTWRGGRPVRQALVRAGDEVEDHVCVETTFDRHIASIAILLEPVTSDRAADEVELVLDGAMRPDDAGPRIVTALGWTALVYDIEPDAEDATVEAAVTVTARVRLAGVLGAAEEASFLADSLAEDGLDRILEPLARPSAALSATWQAANDNP